jgi:hypothetical protein
MNVSTCAKGFSAEETPNASRKTTNLRVSAKSATRAIQMTTNWVVNMLNAKPTNNAPMINFATSTCARLLVWPKILAEETPCVQPSITSRSATVNLVSLETHTPVVD